MKILCKFFEKCVFGKFLKFLKFKKKKFRPVNSTLPNLVKLRLSYVRALTKPEHLLRGNPTEFFKMAEK
jgi:hypothetical protein